MTSPPPLPPPGWYPNPSGEPGQRYWDGLYWRGTDQPQPVPQQRAAPSTGRNWAIAGAGIGVIVLLGFIGSMGDSDEAYGPSRPMSTTSVRATATSPPVRATQTVAPPGAPARDGQFEFKVLDSTSANTLNDPSGNPYMTETAQGVFVIFTLSVRNIGNEPRSYSGMNQRLIDTNGRQYEASSGADILLNDYGLLDKVNPGNSIEVELAFDVPSETQMSMLELHDSMFSAGARVAAAAAP